MKTNEILREIMKDKNIGLTKLADRMQKSPRLVSDRLRLENISVDKLVEILRFLDYDLAIIPRGETGRVSGAYVVEGRGE